MPYIFELIDFALMVLLGLAFISQVAIPVLSGQPIFPWFRHAPGRGPAPVLKMDDHDRDDEGEDHDDDAA